MRAWQRQVTRDAALVGAISLTSALLGGGFAAAQLRHQTNGNGNGSGNAASPRTINVTGTGQVRGTPNVLDLTLGPHDFVTQVGVFFTRLAVVTFGGAYAVLTYMAQDVVTRHGWLDARQMIDGLGLAETTPGPLILVGEFVGYVAGARAGGTGTALACAGITLWATFAPCFVWIFTGAPWLAWISAQPRLRGALAAITSAVAGVILQLAVWFALHTWFAKVLLVRAGPLQLWTPQPASVDGAAIALSAIAAALVFWRRWPMLRVLATMAVLGALARLVWAAP